MSTCFLAKLTQLFVTNSPFGGGSVSAGMSGLKNLEKVVHFPQEQVAHFHPE
jgi:hypothetical protein